MQCGYSLSQNFVNGLHNDWILLDSQSTISVFKNKRLLKNIRQSANVMRAITNGGHQDSNMIGDFPNLGPVWYNPNSLANILSLAHVVTVCRVTMDTREENSMCIHRKDGTIMKFQQHPGGLYVFDPYLNDNINGKVTAYTLLSTVKGQKDMFTRREVKLANQARALQRLLGRPTDTELQNKQYYKTILYIILR
jgi:hypothetical protein